MLAVRIAAALTCAVAVGFGAPTTWVSRRLLRDGELPTFMGLFPMYGGWLFERVSHRVFILLLAVFTIVCCVDVYAGYEIWEGSRAGAWLTIGLLPVEAVFWFAFELPIPPLIALVRFAALAIGWAALM